MKIIASNLTISKKNQLPPNFNTLEAIEKNLLSRQSFTPQDLIKYQVLAQKFHLKIELSTRVADGISAGIKRLQTQSQ
jgi:hypothetical protein